MSDRYLKVTYTRPGRPAPENQFYSRIVGPLSCRKSMDKAILKIIDKRNVVSVLEVPKPTEEPLS